MPTPEYFNELFANKLPGYLGIVVTHMGGTEVRAKMEINPSNIAPNGFLFAGSVVTLGASRSAPKHGSTRRNKPCSC